MVTLDPNDPAYKLAQAAQASVNGDLDAIDRAFEEQKPTTRTLTRAYAMCLMNMSPFGAEATRLILSTLQYRLAEKSARRLYALTWVIATLTGVLIVFGLFDRLHGCLPQSKTREPASLRSVKHAAYPPRNKATAFSSRG